MLRIRACVEGRGVGSMTKGISILTIFKHRIRSKALRRNMMVEDKRREGGPRLDRESR